MTRPTESPEPPPVEWCDHCERDVIEGRPQDHDEGCPRHQPPPPPPCSVCRPRPDEHKRSSPVFCETHDMDDYRAMIRHAEEQRADARRRHEERLQAEYEAREADDAE